MALTMRDLIPLLSPQPAPVRHADIAGTIMKAKALEERKRANQAHEAFLRDDLAEKERASQAVQKREMARIAETRRAAMAADTRAREKARREQAAKQGEAAALFRERAAAGAPQSELRAMGAELGALGIDVNELKATGPLPDASPTELREPMTPQRRPIAAFDMPALQMQSPGPLRDAPEPGTPMGRYQLEADGGRLGDVDAAGIQQEQRASTLGALHGLIAGSRPQDRGARQMAAGLAMDPVLAADPDRLKTIEGVADAQLDREAADRRAAMSNIGRRETAQRSESRADRRFERMESNDALRLYRDIKKDLRVSEMIENAAGFAKVETLLEEGADNPAAVAAAVTQLSKSIGESGRLTDADIARAMGVERDSVRGWIEQFHAEKTRGGVSDHVRDNILEAAAIAQRLTREKLRESYGALQKYRSRFAPGTPRENPTAYDDLGASISGTFSSYDFAAADEDGDGALDANEELEHLLGEP